MPKHWRTTVCAICAAVGEILHDATASPAWVNLVGKCLTAAGIAGLGYSAADRPAIKAELEQRSKENETKYAHKV